MNELERLYAMRDASERQGPGYAARLKMINERIAEIERKSGNA